MSDKDLDKAVSAIFEKYDKDKNGWLDQKQLKAIITDIFSNMGDKRPITDDDAKKVLSAMDKNKDGRIEPAELKEIIKRVMKK